MRFFVTGFLICALMLGCQKPSSNGKAGLTKSPSLKLLSEFKTEIPEPSGLAYNSKTNTLFTVSDGNSTVYEIDFTGKILSSLKIDNVDLEGIAFSANCDTMYVVDEAYHYVSQYLKDGKKLYTFSVNVATNQQHSIEGITVDDKNHLIVLNEKKPCLIMEFVNQKRVSSRVLNYTEDCSGICYDKALSCFWLISDESQEVIKLSNKFEMLAEYSISFKKGEGIAVVGDKIFIVNDDNGKLYVFQKP
ncbi:MAG: SdiA-regulated domain-containing protein [Melioribacteraceae bacterium]